jgi:hypothetical protein
MNKENYIKHLEKINQIQQSFIDGSFGREEFERRIKIEQLQYINILTIENENLTHSINTERDFSELFQFLEKYKEDK